MQFQSYTCIQRKVESGNWKFPVLNLIIYLRFYVLLKNISLIWWRHHCRWRAAKFRLRAFEQGLGSLSCHTCCYMGHRFFHSHPKDRPIQSPLTTHEGMWRVYSNLDPYGVCIKFVLNVCNRCRGNERKLKMIEQGNTICPGHFMV
jgi:hypothetical protein